MLLHNCGENEYSKLERVTGIICTVDSGYLEVEGTL